MEGKGGDDGTNVRGRALVRRPGRGGEKGRDRMIL